MKTPALPLVFYNSFTDIPMVLDFNTIPFFQLHHLARALDDELLHVISPVLHLLFHCFY